MNISNVPNYSKGTQKKMQRRLSQQRLEALNSSVVGETRRSFTDKRTSVHGHLEEVVDIPRRSSFGKRNSADVELKYLTYQSIVCEDSMNRFKTAGLSDPLIKELMTSSDFQDRSLFAMSFHIYGIHGNVIEKLIKLTPVQLILIEERVSSLSSLGVSSEAVGVSIVLNSNISKRNAYVRQLRENGVSGENLDLMLLQADLDGVTCDRVDELVGGVEFTRQDRLMLAHSLLHSEILKSRLM